MASVLKCNWKTSLAGAVFAAALFVSTSPDFSIAERKWAGALAAAAGGTGLLASRDHDK